MAGALPRLPELGPISPELVLVDPELARLIRTASLAELDGFVHGPEPEPRPEVRIAAAVRHMRDYEAWGDDLRLFLAPAVDEETLFHRAFPGWPPARRALRPVEEPADDVALRPRRSPKRALRVGLIAATVVVLGGAGAAVASLVAGSAPYETATEAGELAPVGQAAVGTAARRPSSATSSTGRPATARESPGTPRVIAWAPTPGAAAYEVALYDGPQRIFHRRTRRARLELPNEWRKGGRLLRLEPGVYRWYVWPVPAGSRKPAVRAVVQARLIVPAA